MNPPRPKPSCGALYEPDFARHDNMIWWRQAEESAQAMPKDSILRAILLGVDAEDFPF